MHEKYAYPLLRAAARSPARLDAAQTIIAEALAAGEIRNVALQDAKVEDAHDFNLDSRPLDARVAAGGC